MTLTNPNTSASLVWLAQAWSPWRPSRLCSFFLAVSILTACAGPTRRPHGDPTPTGTTILTSGDWDDLDAAIEAACEKTEHAVLRRVAFQLEPAEVVNIATRRRAYDLVTSGDEPTRVTFVAQQTGDPTPITITARVGRHGDTAREAELLNTIKRRLTELEGKDFAPMR